MGQVLRKRAVDSLHLFTQVLVFSPISNLRLLQRMFLRRAIFFFFLEQETMRQKYSEVVYLTISLSCDSTLSSDAVCYFGSP